MTEEMNIEQSGDEKGTDAEEETGTIQKLNHDLSSILESLGSVTDLPELATAQEALNLTTKMSWMDDIASRNSMMEDMVSRLSSIADIEALSPNPFEHELISAVDLPYIEPVSVQEERRHGELIEQIKTLTEVIKEQKKSQPIEDTPVLTMPTKPSKDAGFVAWFDYYHHCKKVKRKYTLQELADDIEYSLPHVKAMHRLYKTERDL